MIQFIKKCVGISKGVFLFCCISLEIVQAAGYDCKAGMHDFQTVIVDQTETESGSITYTCQMCGYSYMEEIPPYGHQWGKWSAEQEPTCVKEGHASRICKLNPSHREEKVLEATGEHTYQQTILKDATTEETGIARYTCSQCGESYTEEIPVRKLGESEEDTNNTERSIESETMRQSETEAQAETETESQSERKKEEAASGTGSDSEGNQRRRGTDGFLPDALDVLLCSVEVLLAAGFSVMLRSQYRILRWDKELEKKYKQT